MRRLYPDLEVPDLIFNIGSGSSEKKPLERLGSSLMGRCIPRLARAYLNLIGGRRAWTDFIWSGCQRMTAKCRRLDVQFRDTEPALDDVEKIPLLRTAVQTDENIAIDIEESAQKLVAGLFYFELCSPPQGGSMIEGKILCVRKSPDPSLSAIIQRLRRLRATFLINNCQFRFRKEFGVDTTGNLRLHLAIPFTDKIAILLREGNSEPQHISGSPFNVDKLVSRQGLRAAFGTGAHKRAIQDASKNSRLPKRRRKVY